MIAYTDPLTPSPQKSPPRFREIRRTLRCPGNLRERELAVEFIRSLTVLAVAAKLQLLRRRS